MTSQPVGTFPGQTGKTRVYPGKESVIYQYDMPNGSVGFLYWLGLEVPENSYGALTVDGERVGIPEVPEKIETTIPLANPACINPPIVVEKEVLVSIYSSVEAEVRYLVSGEIHQKHTPTAPPQVPCEPPVVVVERPPTEIDKILEKFQEIAREVKVPKRKTYTIDSTVSGRFTVFDEKTPGELKELSISSSNQNYQITVWRDGDKIYDDPWSDFQTKSTRVSQIAAYEENGVFILNLTDVKWTRTAKIELYTPASADIYCKWELETQ